ncbi:chalcone isomerase family protein [Desulfuromonas carbonis]|uniref:chalcone isomerase family protein n=1 Tax=Desulfuromonas sp. DDH964 TaxID=1823759 RepID=UPI00078BC060|nr:chalcone isomerase family protein [Desulfuromonas sp. DDH964]AMV70849.1 hypothetical protein DBW_0448 [Desulfuromonas sp. DDH964]
MLKRLLPLLLVGLMLVAGNAAALEVAGVQLAPEVGLGGERLQLNGYGIRKKFFFKIYVGSLYTAQPATSTAQVLALPGAKLVRMDFVYDKVDKKKIVDAFAEGFEKNSPGLVGSASARAFLGWFDADFVRGDRVDLQVGADGTVSASHNGRVLGSVTDPALARGVLLIYLGEQPADADLKAGMLGQD